MLSSSFRHFEPCSYSEDILYVYTFLIYLSYFGEFGHAVLLWRSRNVLWSMKNHPTILTLTRILLSR